MNDTERKNMREKYWIGMRVREQRVKWKKKEQEKECECEANYL